MIWLGLVSFFTDISSEMIFPIVPIFLTSVLNANMAVVGLIEGIAESTSAILQLASGWLSDKLKKRKALVFAGYAFSTVTKPFLAFASVWWHVLVIRFADRVGKGVRTAPRDALIAASSKKSERGRYFGLHRMLDTSGAIIGTLIASLLLAAISYSESTFRTIFLLSAIPGLIALAIILLKVKETGKADARKKPARLTLKISGFSRDYKMFLFVIGLFNLAHFSYAFFILRASNIGVALALIPILYLVYNIFYAVLAMPAGRLSDRLGRKNVLSAGLLLFSAVSLGFAFWANSASMWVLFALYGIFMAVTDGVSRAYVSDLAKSEKRGLALGAYHAIDGITVLPANIIGGFLWASFSPEAPFIYAAGISAVSAFLLFALVKKK